MSKKDEKPLPLQYRLKGKLMRKCRFCGSSRGMIRSYGLRICRRCFRDMGERIGFRKF
ncbi:30S ribosomal protein S14 type Z [uncultured archaeon]|nr:30S ribosomal protein S14 type Z [uncultured archaeon]